MAELPSDPFDEPVIPIGRVELDGACIVVIRPGERSPLIGYQVETEDEFALIKAWIASQPQLEMLRSIAATLRDDPDAFPWAPKFIEQLEADDS